jgi:F-type H+-transporting ATPase subunit alpha
MRSVSGSLRLDLSQYRELEAFAAFGSDLDAASAAALGRGGRLVELLKQSQYAPFPVEEQVVSIWLGTTGKLDDVAVDDVRRFEADFLDNLRRTKSELLAAIRETGKFEEETEQALEAEVVTFKHKLFQGTGADGIQAGREDEDDAAEKALESEQEQIVKQKR